jgi:hypothetical protein
MKKSIQRHELRDAEGNLIAVVETVIENVKFSHDMIELAADVAGAAYRVRIFPPKARAITKSAA